MKADPPDPTIEKKLIIGVKSTGNGDVLAIGIADVAKGKVEESLKLGTEQDFFIAVGIEGFKLEIPLINCIIYIKSPSESTC